MTLLLRLLFLVGGGFVLMQGLPAMAANGPAPPSPAIAIHYGANAPLDTLKVFDIVVVEPDHGHDPQAQRQKGLELFAYASVAEVQPSRSYFQNIPAAWQLSRNKDWQSVVVDQTPKEWPAFFADKVIAPLWQKGYRGFFLDTMDSYRLAEKFDEAAQQEGLVRLIQELHKKFPGIRLIMNRGFEIAPRVKGLVEMVAAESLFRRWNAAANQYEEVPSADREWLLSQLTTLRDQWGIPGLVIDYVPAHDRATARETARQIQAAGFTPWVSDAALSTVGIGRIESIPRRILMLYNGAEVPGVTYTEAHRFWQMPLNHMGYVVDYADIRNPLPKDIFQDRYAGIVTAFSGFVPSNRTKELAQWLIERKNEGLRIAMVDDFGMTPDKSWAQSFGLQLAIVSPANAPTRVQTHESMGLETAPPRPGRDATWVRFTGAQANAAKPWVEAKDARGQTIAAGAITSWGGLMLSPYTYIELPGTDQYRWVVNPFEFLRNALALPPFPVPDVTTENGRRLLMAHIDGDGFPSRAELPGSPFAGQVLLKEILEKYRIPQTMSIIEGETAPHGLHPELSPQLEDIARKMFQLPHVEMASHSFSHPFLWNTEEKHGVFSDGKEADYHLKIPGYTPDTVREIQGSAQYIQKRLAPAGKTVKLFQWTGDTSPGIPALKAAYDAGLLNINGGDTFISKNHPSLTAVRSLGIFKGGYLQVYAPIANENIFTNLWRGPFYGFERVLETFDMTDRPRRIKPVNIYYHTYSASKPASLQALHKVYTWAMSQPLHPVYTSDYIRKVHDFYSFAVALDGDGWRVRGDGPLRTLRLPFADAISAPLVTQSQGLAGWKEAAEGTYVHMHSHRAWIPRPSDRTKQAAAGVWLHDANGRLTQWVRDDKTAQIRFSLQGHVPLHFSLRGMEPQCKAVANGVQLTPRAPAANESASIRSYQLADAFANIQVHCAAR